MSRTISAIQVRGLSKRYGRQRALAAVDLRFQTGTACALLGANGAGKSTLLGILSTLVRPTSGEVLYDTANGDKLSGPALRAQIGVLAHSSFLYPGLTARENLQFFARLYGANDGADTVAKALDEVGLERPAWDRPVSGYSRGMIQRLSLARALLHRPRVLLLDEPFTGLDKQGASALANRLAQLPREGVLLIVVSHDLEVMDGLCAAGRRAVPRKGCTCQAAKRFFGWNASPNRVFA